MVPFVDPSRESFHLSSPRVSEHLAVSNGAGEAARARPMGVSNYGFGCIGGRCDSGGSGLADLSLPLIGLWSFDTWRVYLCAQGLDNELINRAGPQSDGSVERKERLGVQPSYHHRSAA